MHKGDDNRFMKLVVNENTLLKVHKMCSKDGTLKLKKNSSILKTLKNKDTNTLYVKLDKTKRNNEIEILDDEDNSLFILGYQNLLDSLEVEENK